ncbi:hypothetical protein XELAEV_18018125mg [Xenopus laevis]|uniref:Uncharacterized protein n=1 Tax=Xenopus laevis TaxID=8355 RepID=A0A974DCM9_XENLA|nr:hypothetical protein XELAEV_18018125mg [Xenopus laevis]
MKDFFEMVMNHCGIAGKGDSRKKRHLETVFQRLYTLSVKPVSTMKKTSASREILLSLYHFAQLFWHSHYVMQAGFKDKLSDLNKRFHRGHLKNLNTTVAVCYTIQACKQLSFMNITCNTELNTV